MVTAPAGEQGLVRQFLVRRREFETVDDWHVTGLAGTGSRTLVADNVFVPSRRTMTQESMVKGTTPGSEIHAGYPVYRTPRRYLTAFSLSPVLVGLAERALTIVVETSARKVAAGQVLPDIESFQLRVAEAAADVETARAIMDRHLIEADRRLAAGEIIGDFDIQRNRMMASHMMNTARRAVEGLCRATGSGWIFDNTALNTVFRDTIAGATHRAMNFDANAKNYARSLGLRLP
jgi:alkylation response protein AidB-like acyl-CoA dehydrogenase